MLAKLNETEKKVLDAAVASSKANGHDFGISEFINPKEIGLTARQFAGYMSQLSQKGYLDIEPTHYATGYPITQFVLTDECKELVNKELQND